MCSCVGALACWESKSTYHFYCRITYIASQMQSDLFFLLLLFNFITIYTILIRYVFTKDNLQSTKGILFYMNYSFKIIFNAFNDNLL